MCKYDYHSGSLHHVGLKARGGCEWYCVNVIIHITIESARLVLMLDTENMGSKYVTIGIMSSVKLTVRFENACN